MTQQTMLALEKGLFEYACVCGYGSDQGRIKLPRGPPTPLVSARLVVIVTLKLIFTRTQLMGKKRIMDPRTHGRIHDAKD